MWIPSATCFRTRVRLPPPPPFAASAVLRNFRRIRSISTPGPGLIRGLASSLSTQSGLVPLQAVLGHGVPAWHLTPEHYGCASSITRIRPSTLLPDERLTMMSMSRPRAVSRRIRRSLEKLVIRPFNSADTFG